MASNFNARNAEAYDRLMGRWSQRLAPRFLAFAGTEPGERIIEMGCGTGSLTFAIPDGAASVTAIDLSPIYVQAARARNTSPKITIEQGDGQALRFPGNSFDRALTMLVLQFMPDPVAALRELARVTRPDGTVAAAVWDTFGGMPAQRMLWDTAAALDPEAARLRARAMTRPAAIPGGLARAFAEAGLVEIRGTELQIRMEFQNFEDYWEPFAAGEGSLGDYVAALGAEALTRLRQNTRDAYLSGARDGPRSFASVAFACRAHVAA